MAAVIASHAVSVTVAKERCTGSMGEKELPAVYKRYICSFPDCSAAYNKNWKLQAHLCKHTGEKPFPCKYDGCDKGFVRRFHLTRHAMTHTGERPCKCEAENCDLSFSTAANMRRHYQRAHISPSLLYVCPLTECGKTFKKHNQLKVHQCIHTGQQPYKCTHEGCDKSFFTPSKLKRHEKVHAGYPCKKDSTCSFVGKTWTDYLKHVETSHTEPAICDVCNRKFKKNSFLKEHMQIHDEERMVFCCPREGCERVYTTKFSLRSHVLSFHEELHSYACVYPGCGKTFAMKQSLDRHVNTHDPQKKKMKKPRPKKSLASRLSGYNPKKSPKKKSVNTSNPEATLNHNATAVPEATTKLQSLSL